MQEIGQRFVIATKENFTPRDNVRIVENRFINRSSLFYQRSPVPLGSFEGFAVVGDRSAVVHRVLLGRVRAILCLLHQNGAHGLLARICPQDKRASSIGISETWGIEEHILDRIKCGRLLFAPEMGDATIFSLELGAQQIVDRVDHVAVARYMVAQEACEPKKRFDFTLSLGW